MVQICARGRLQIIAEGCVLQDLGKMYVAQSSWPMFKAVCTQFNLSDLYSTK